MKEEKKKSNIIDKILDDMSPERKRELDEALEKQHKFLEKLRKEGKIWGTPTSHSLDVMRKHGYEPIAITTIICEETFIFKTKKEALDAYQELEVEKCIVDGWWYDEEQFEEEYKTLKYKPEIHKL